MTKTPRDVLTDALRNNPKASDKELLIVCTSAFERSTELRNAVYAYWFVNNRKSVEITQNRFSHVLKTVKRKAPQKPAPTPARERERVNVEREHKATERKAIERRAVDTVKARIINAVLMDWPLANGTRLRDATGSMVAKESGWLADIARVIKPNQTVGKHLTEADLQNIRNRTLKQAKVA